MTRAIIHLPVAGGVLVGTHHRPDPAGSTGIGFLFLNAGPAPRAGNSDLSVYLCDRLASLGFDAFRVDLPGLGDSPGELPAEVEAFWVEVQRGRNVNVTLDLARGLRDRFGFKSLVAGGVCAGAVTCLFAADRAPDLISGLVLLEPNLYAPSAARLRLPRREKLASLGWGRNWLERGWMSGRWLRHLTGRRSLARRMEPLLPVVLRVAELLAGPSPEVNQMLVASWRRVLAARVPTFLAVVHEENQDHFCTCVLSEVPRGERKLVTELKVHGTNHILTRSDARDTVKDAVGCWAQSKREQLLAAKSRPLPSRNPSLPLRPAAGPGELPAVARESSGVTNTDRQALGLRGP